MLLLSSSPAVHLTCDGPTCETPSVHHAIVPFPCACVCAALYYMIIEVLGRPRLPVHTIQGYFILSFLVVFVILVVPWRLVRLAEALRRQNVYTRQVYMPSSQGSHVLLAGHVTVASMFEFLSDFFHEDVHALMGPPAPAGHPPCH